ncbi:hypothetical protein [Streptomyces coerulescens]|uniref:Uncharacterized protein n=1 Tax=Streptomyces coerulescens TaxID=29304 RepID=A0ABW0D1S0_STRCD
MRVIANRVLFQLKINYIRNVVMIPPRATGRITWKKARGPVAPSIAAASSSTEGTAAKEPGEEINGERQRQGGVNEDQACIAVGQLDFGETDEHRDQQNLAGDAEAEYERQSERVGGPGASS